jgi:uncharacterized LabA/DUF88 family protein
MAEKIAVYVDGANAYFAQKEALGWWIDWPSFLSVMKEGRELVSVRWYQAYRGTPEPEQDRFLHHLTLIGFAVRKKILKNIFDKITGETTVKGNLDVELTIDALTEANHYDTAILVTGDSDFVSLVEALRSRGKRVWVVATQQNVAVELRQAVGVNYIDLRDLRHRIESAKRAPEPRNDRAERADRPERPDRLDRAERAERPERPERPEPVPRNGGPRERVEEAGAPVNGDEIREDDPEAGLVPAPPREDIALPQEGEIVRCHVQAVKRYGVFLDLHESVKTLLHVKDMNRGFVGDAAEFYRVGDQITVQIVSIDWSRTPPEVRVQVTTPEMEY